MSVMDPFFPQNCCSPHPGCRSQPNCCTEDITSSALASPAYRLGCWLMRMEEIVLISSEYHMIILSDESRKAWIVQQNYSRLTVYSHLCLTVQFKACYFACGYYCAYNKGKILLETTEQCVKSTNSCRHKQLHYHTCKSLRRGGNTLQFHKLLWQWNCTAFCLCRQGTTVSLVHGRICSCRRAPRK
jgi:hypothetical protein